MSPHGEVFELVGRAGPVTLNPPPSVATEAREDLLVLKHDACFLCARPDGDIRLRGVSGEGFYFQDTRFLSTLEVRVGQVRPVVLSSSLSSGHAAVIDATNPALTARDGTAIGQETLQIRRDLMVHRRMHCVISVRSYAAEAVELDVSVRLGADYADVFEVRSAAHRDTRGEVFASKLHPERVVFAYLGDDGEHRETRVRLDPPATTVVDSDDGTVIASWTLRIEPRTVASLVIVVEASIGNSTVAPRPSAEVAEEATLEEARWSAGCTSFTTDAANLARLLEVSRRDLHALLTSTDGARIPAAGIPWYVAAFGRDAIWTSQMALLLEPAVAHGTLQVLAGLQADGDDPWRDAEPGKILHELRRGELARAGIIPHTPYYGSVDATPLFLILAGTYYRWTGDLATLQQLRPHLDAALYWIDTFGDSDGDGFIEYQRRSAAGLLQQGWKDSHDAIMHADGRPATGPIALVEAQAYVYLAKTEIAAVYAAFGDAQRAASLRTQASVLQQRFEAAFWDADAGGYVLALDGDKRQVRSVTSNQAHVLYCGIAAPDRAARVAARLLAPDMFSGWGLRTLSSDSPAYNPMSYHNGSVWPHDTAIAAAGLARYGHRDAANRLVAGLLEVGALARDRRLPELFCGFSRSHSPTPVSYPVACIPQAWAAVSPFLMLQALLGIHADAPAGALAITSPTLPQGVTQLVLRDLRVGSARVTLSFREDAGVTSFSLMEQHGDLRVTMTA